MPRSLQMTLKYFTIEELIGFIDEPNRTACMGILKENRKLFETAQGSTHNHQAWKGGYIDHITDGMNFIYYLYDFLESFGRQLPFSKRSALVVFFVHDLEKPWRIQLDAYGIAYNAIGLTTKDDFRNFREKKIRETDVVLNDYQMNALTYVEGEHKDYTSERRVMNELAALCHMADNWCACGWHDHPKAINEGWIGAGRVRTTW